MRVGDLAMTIDVQKELAALEQMSVGQLQDCYAELTGERTRSRHRVYLVRRVIWLIQAKAYGGLSERAKQRAEELARDADVRVTPPKHSLAFIPTMGDGPVVRTVVSTDDRLPAPGGAITREYKGRTLRVVVLPDGFEFEGERFRSLSAIAKKVTGSHVNGFRFFRLGSAA